MLQWFRIRQCLCEFQLLLMNFSFAELWNPISSLDYCNETSDTWFKSISIIINIIFLNVTKKLIFSLVAVFVNLHIWSIYISCQRYTCSLTRNAEADDWTNGGLNIGARPYTSLKGLALHDGHTVATDIAGETEIARFSRSTRHINLTFQPFGTSSVIIFLIKLIQNCILLVCLCNFPSTFGQDLFQWNGSTRTDSKERCWVVSFNDANDDVITCHSRIGTYDILLAFHVAVLLWTSVQVRNQKVSKMLGLSHMVGYINDTGTYMKSGSALGLTDRLWASFLVRYQQYILCRKMVKCENWIGIGLSIWRGFDRR